MWFAVSKCKKISYFEHGKTLLGRAQPVIPPNLYSLMFKNIIAWGPQVTSVLNHSTVELQDFSKKPPVN